MVELKQVCLQYIYPLPSDSLTTPKTVEALKKKLETGRRRADAAEARTAELEKLNAEKGEKLEELQEKLRLSRQALITVNHLLPVLQKLRDAQIKYALSFFHLDI